MRRHEDEIKVTVFQFICQGVETTKLLVWELFVNEPYHIGSIPVERRPQ
jgi:hypothetical protein